MRVHTYSAMKQVKSINRNRIVDETPDDSVRLATTNIGIAKERDCPKSLDHRHPTIEMCNKLLLYNNFNDALTYSIFTFLDLNLVKVLGLNLGLNLVKVISPINMLEVASKLSRYCKMARWSNVVGPRCVKSLLHQLKFYITA